MAAINHALIILSWFEHLPEEEMPPRWMWSLNEELEEHFDRVKDNRKSGHRSDDDESGPMMRNELAKNRGRNAR